MYDVIGEMGPNGLGWDAYFMVKCCIFSRFSDGLFLDGWEDKDAVCELKRTLLS